MPGKNTKEGQGKYGDGRPHPTYARPPKPSGKNFQHWHPSVTPHKGFPFTFHVKPYTEEQSTKILESVDCDIVLKVVKSDNMLWMLREELIQIFPFAKYFDVNSPDFLGPSPTKNPLKYIIKVEIYVTETYTKKSGKEGTRAVLAKTFALRVDNFASEFQFNLIRSLEQLEEVLAPDHERIGFDLESTGLHPIKDYIVGACFALEPKVGYYVPIRHDEEFDRFNLGHKALDLLYNKICRTPITDMFNGRFDMRLMEFSDNKYDMSKVYVIDSQATTWYADPDYGVHALKPLAQRFNGYYRPDLAKTMKNAGVDGFNFGKLHPEDALFYGAMDGIDTLEIGINTYQYYLEFGTAAQIDQKLLYPLMKLENEPMQIDMEYLQEQVALLGPKLKKINEEIQEALGDYGVVNLNSPKQKVKLFKSFGLDTGIKTRTKKMSVSKDAVSGLVARLRNRNEEPPKWLTLLNERSRLDKLYNTFFYPLSVQAKIHGGEVRVSYRNTVAATGRLSSGKEELQNL